MTVPTFVQPTVGGDTPTEYKANIDAAVAVMAEIARSFAPHETATPAMTVTIDAGRLMINGTLVSQSAQTSGTITAPVTLPRIDRIVINELTGAISVVTGAEAASPVAPAIPVGYLPCAQIALATSTTAITNSLITDERTHSNILGYEEGTFTPTVQDSSLSDAEGQTYSTQAGKYTKIGNVVFVQIYLVLTSLGTLTSTNTLSLAGLPYASASNPSSNGYGVLICPKLTGLTSNILPFPSVTAGATRLTIGTWNPSTGAYGGLTVGGISATSQIIISGYYLT